MYYKIEHNTDAKVSGSTYPQAECLTLSNAHSIKFDEFSNPDNLKLEFKLASRAKLTDVLSQAAISAHGLLINQKLRDILEGFNLMQHQYYPVNVVTKKSIEQYYWLHLVDNSFVHFIEYSESKFFRTKFAYREEEIDLESYEDYIEKKTRFGTMCGIQSDFLKLTSNFKSRLDLFVFSRFDSSIYVTEKLKSKISDIGFTGIMFETASTIG